MLGPVTDEDPRTVTILDALHTALVGALNDLTCQR